MTRPYSNLIAMTAALTAIILLAAWMHGPLLAAFHANAAFNGVIVAVLLVGIAINYRQVIRLFSEIAWLDVFRRRDPEQRMQRQPKLLSAVARMLSQRKRGEFTLSTMSARTLLDSIHMRLDESRDLARYLIGLLIFLGLLGTFWGLLLTISAVGGVIDQMQFSSDSANAFAQLQDGLRQPLSGMGIAFSSSLFGLAGSLILGFLDLQAGHAQNRFFNELEEWLSSVTRLSSGTLGEADAGVPAYVQALLEQTADSLERLERTMEVQHRDRGQLDQQIRALSIAVQRLAASQTGDFDESLRQEFRLLNRTLATALSNN